MALILHHAPNSVCSQKVRVGLAELGLDWEGVVLDLAAGDQFRPEFRRLNPEAVVPVLVDDGLVVTESSLILEHLDRKTGGELTPEGAAGQAARLWLLRCINIHAAINTLSFGTAMGAALRETKTDAELDALAARFPDPLMGWKRVDLIKNGLSSIFAGQALSHLHRMFSDMDAALQAGPWVSGGEFGISDVALVAYLDRLDRLGFDLLWQDRPAVAKWLARMRARPSYAAGIGDYIPADMAARLREGGAAHRDALSRLWATARDRADAQAAPG